MQVNHEQLGRGLGLTVTEQARRAQIIEATIDTVAELGYGRTSFAKIVERAGLSSTRMISYHFRGKDELMLATAGAIVDNQDSFLTERLAGTRDRVDMLRTWIRAEVAFLGAHPRQARALLEIGTNARSTEGPPLLDAVWRDMRVGRLERQLAQGQREGVFGAFDVEVLALAIRQAIDGVALRLAAEPELDLDTYGRQLADLFSKAARA
ncbi:TetR/AcrR family transcriptional regulator [Prauserella muralis]|uniref:TetR family transcriptional regulator n=1 Tax=Prauserella muralis TaxID=588067 RepID=A0A2V4ANV4_9PSEU|nr:TetR/AcrR family transcriptional regulator [Prauserella muralis]PXY22383.1 TetR family transcriptional regulator [Prauserella muralis]TWE28041.1 TetR family transcriptional regulator [Prauserella muralis]